MILRSLPRILLLGLASLAAPASAQADPAAAAGTDTTEVYETRHNHVLAFPRYVWNTLTWPLGKFTIWAERKGVFTGEGEEKTSGWSPYAALDGVGPGEETGTGGGITVFHSGFSARMIANRSNYGGKVLYEVPGIGDGSWYWNASVDALKTESENATMNGRGLNGRGQGRRPESLLQYEQRDAGIALGRRSNHGRTEGYVPDAVLELRLSHGFRRYDDAGDRPSGIPGANEAINLFSAGARWTFDDRDFKPPVRTVSHPLNYQFPGRVLLLVDDRYYSFRDTAFPERGGLTRVEADYVIGSGDVRYFRYAAEVQRFFTLFYSHRILAVRARLEKAHPLGGDGTIPHSDLTTLGGSQRLRGYKRGHFRDRGSLLLSAEYRYPIWDTWNAFLFWDQGQVFGEYGALEMDRFDYSYGAGLSLRTERAFLLGLHLARSEEERALAGVSLEREF